MVRLQQFAGADTGKSLANLYRRLSFCPECCCPNLPNRLYLHVVPTRLNAAGAEDPNCEYDQENDDYPMQGDFQQSNANHCVEWWTDNSGFLIDAQPCWEGNRGDQFGVGVHLYCVPTNQFVIDICWLLGGQPTYPDDNNCNLLMRAETPIDEHTCGALPGEFYLDFGNYIPQRGRPTAAPTNFDCECQFHLYIDEHGGPGGTLGERNPEYFFPAEGSGGLPGLEGMEWFFEEADGVGTPEHPKFPPTLYAKRETCPGVGTRIGRIANSLGWKYRNESGCNCNQLMTEMNRAGPDEILKNLDEWSERMKNSARKWYKVVRDPGMGGIIRRAVKPLALLAVKRLIRRECLKEMECRHRTITTT